MSEEKEIYKAIKLIKECKNQTKDVEIGEVLTTDRVFIGFPPALLDYTKHSLSETYLTMISFDLEMAEWISKEIMKSVRKRKKGLKQKL